MKADNALGPRIQIGTCIFGLHMNEYTSSKVQSTQIFIKTVTHTMTENLSVELVKMFPLSNVRLIRKINLKL